MKNRGVVFLGGVLKRISAYQQISCYHFFCISPPTPPFLFWHSPPIFSCSYPPNFPLHWDWDLFKTLTDAHSAIAHRGRDKTEHYVRERYSGINQEVIELFVSLCILHQSQRSVTSYVKKPVVKPIAADGFLMHVEIDLTDFRNLPCSCSPSHNWVLHINDHYSKYSWLIPLISKTCEQVVQALQNVFYMFGFPKTLHSDNGKEFTGKRMREFCKSNSIS